MVAPGDREIRTALLARLRADSSVSVLTEYTGLGDANPDVLTVGGALHLYEIKSDRDSLARLTPPGGFQIHGYCLSAERVTVVAGPRHVAALLDLVPSWWGITVARPDGAGGVVLADEWPGAENPEPIVPWRAAWFLTPAEARALAREHGVSLRGVPRDKGAVLRALCAALPYAAVRAAALAAFRARIEAGHYRRSA